MRNRLKTEIEQLAKCVEIRHAVLTEDGEVMEVDLMTWAIYLEKGRAQRTLAQEDLPGGYWISTIFLGLNHQYSPGAKPLWFETMIFAPSDGKYNELLKRIPKHGPEVFCERYTTLEEALAGHETAKLTWTSRQSDLSPRNQKGRPRF